MPMPDVKYSENATKSAELFKKDSSRTHSNKTIEINKWVEKEFEKIFNHDNSNIEYDFSNINFLLFKDDDLYAQEAFYDEENNLIGINHHGHYTGYESDLQENVIHECAHAATISPMFVGTSISEGIALFFERKWLINNNLSFNYHYFPENYQFSLNIIDLIISKIYHNNFFDFYNSIKKGNEEKFINDLNKFFCQTILKYNRFIRLTSIIFYAKEYQSKNNINYPLINEYMEEILNALDNKTISIYSNLFQILPAIELIEMIRYFYSKKMSKSQFMVFSLTFDRNLGIELFKGIDLFNKPTTILNVLKDVLKMLNYESEVSLEMFDMPDRGNIKKI